MGKLENKGFSLIELIIGIAILSVVGLAAAGLFGSSLHMYRSTITYADVQTESQTISRRLTAVIMEAQNIYYSDTSEGTFLFTGDRTAENTYSGGSLMWFNKETGCLYQRGDGISMEGTVPKNTKEEGALSADTVKAAVGGGTYGKTYLISSKVKALQMTVDEEKMTISYTITMQYQDGKDYVVNSGATPRNKLGYFRWNAEN